jgi:hypothetical protein
MVVTCGADLANNTIDDLLVMKKILTKALSSLMRCACAQSYVRH